jgi:hypothetical protein
MTGKIILGAVGLIVVVVAAISAPDFIRYMKIRSM